MTGIQKIVSDLEQQRAAIDQAIAALREVSGTATVGRRTPATPKKRRRRLSAEGKARIAEAQRKRWAQKRAASSAGTAPGRRSTAVKATSPAAASKRLRTKAMKKSGKNAAGVKRTRKVAAKSTAQPVTGSDAAM